MPSPEQTKKIVQAHTKTWGAAAIGTSQDLISGDTVLARTTIPAGALRKPGSVVRFFAAGAFPTGAAQNTTLKVEISTVSVAESLAIQPATSDVWAVEGRLVSHGSTASVLATFYTGTPSDALDGAPEAVSMDLLSNGVFASSSAVTLDIVAQGSGTTVDARVDVLDVEVCTLPSVAVTLD